MSCPNSDVIEVCSKCKEWTQVCEPCCNGGVSECEECLYE